MATIIKGTSKCPECGSEQNVKHDGRKYFITCTECKTMTSYQSKVAKVRIEKRLKPIDTLPEDSETLSKTATPESISPKYPPTPARVNTGFFDNLNDLF